jgi:hypothetical protein
MFVPGTPLKITRFVNCSFLERFLDRIVSILSILVPLHFFFFLFITKASQLGSRQALMPANRLFLMLP